MKKLLSFVLVVILSLSLTVTAFASTTSAKWNGGEKINFNPLKYHTVYTPSSSYKDLVNKYGVTWYEEPTRFVLKGEAMFVQLRIIQASLERRGYKLLSANGETLSNFQDTNTLVQSALEEAKILKAIGVLSGSSNSYMNMDQYTTRAEIAKIVAVTNQSVLGIPDLRSAPSFTDISGNWAESYIIQAYKIGIMDGIYSSSFYPSNAVTLEQLLDILDNEVGYYGITVQDVAKAMNETFKATFNLNPIRITPELSSYSVKKYDEVKVKVNVYPSSSKDLVFTSYDENICKIQSVSQYSDTATIKGYSTGSTYIKVYLKDEPDYFAMIPIYVTGNTISATSISVNDKISIEVGDNYYLTSTVQPYNATDKSVRYSSSDTSVATVDSYGRVYGKSKGTVVITAKTHNGYEDYCIVTVNSQQSTTIPATGITVTSNLSVEVGSAYYINSVVLPYNATNRTATYYTSDSSVARVNSNGLVTGIGKGTAVITAQTHNGYNVYCIVTVTDKNVAATGITVNSTLNLKEDSVYYLSTSVLPYNTTNKTVTYYSDDTSIAKVNSNGMVTGVRKGTTVITAQTHNGYKAYCVVTVEAKNVATTGITVNSEINIEAGSAYYLTSTVLPYNATDKSVIYYSDDTSVATVNSNGMVTGVNKGVAVITAQTISGHKAYCVVKVGQSIISATGITVETEVKLQATESKYLTAIVTPYSATDRTVKYYSDDSSIATVDSSGKVTGIKAGTTVITVETHNGYKAYCVVTVTAKSNPSGNSRSYVHVDTYEESSYYNAFNNETIKFIVNTDLSITSVTLSNSYCYISEGVTSHSDGWKFTVKTSTLSQNGETLLTVTLSNGEQLNVRICIYP